MTTTMPPARTAAASKATALPQKEHRFQLRHRAQTLAFRALQPGNSVCLPWGRGLGKTWLVRHFWYTSVARWEHVWRTGALRPFRGVRIVHLMPTFKQCKDVYADLVEADLAPDGEWGWLGAKINRTSWQITFPGGSWIKWFGTREANASRGLRADELSADECDDLDPEDIDAVARPWFSEPWSLRIQLFGGTPRRGRYGLLYREHKAGLNPDLPHKFSFHATYEDAPQLVSPEYVEQIRTDPDTPPEVFNREWKCDFDTNEGLVYGLFNEQIHVREPPPKQVWTEVLVGVDHGWEHPGVFLVIGVIGSGKDSVCWVIDEIASRHRVEDWWVEEAKKIRVRFPHARWYADPSQPARIMALRTRAGVNIVEADNAVEDGISAVANRLAMRKREESRGGQTVVVEYSRLFISKKARQTLFEIVNYRRKKDPKNADRVLDEIIKVNDDAMDALRYGVFTRFGRPPPRRELPDGFVA